MCFCWGIDEEDGDDTDTVAVDMAAANARAIAIVVGTTETPPRAAREPPSILLDQHSHSRYYSAMRRMTSGESHDNVSLAAYFNDVATMKTLVLDKTRPTMLFEDALKLAVVQGNLEVVDVLMSSGAAQGAPGHRLIYRAPLRLAALRGNRQMFAMLVKHTSLDEGESLSRVTQDILLDGAGRNMLAMLICLSRMPGGFKSMHWKDALVAAVAHVFYRPLVIRLCLALDNSHSAIAEAVDTACFLGNVGALRILTSIPHVRPPRRETNSIRPLNSGIADVLLRLRVRVLLHRRNGLQRAILAVRSFRERYYSPPSGPGFLIARQHFVQVTKRRDRDDRDDRDP